MPVIFDPLALFEGDFIDYFKDRQTGNVVCPNCGFQLLNYAETGRFGCSKCYDTFHSEIKRIIHRIEGGV